MATGMAIMGFGGGAMIAKLSIDRLLAKFYKAPEYLGSEDSVSLILKVVEDLLRYPGILQKLLL